MREEIIGNCRLILGDCMESLRKMPDNSVDSIVTDPPYGLAFMGKKWDYDVPSVEIWAECLRVLKPGGHLLAFAGTRTQHRMAVRIEDAGFEIRDMIAWVYGSGFPKSLDVSKALDKAAGAEREVVGIRESYRPKANATRDPEGFQDRSDGAVTLPATDAAKQWEGWGTALKPALETVTMARKPLMGTVAANVLAHGTGALNIDGCRVGAEDGYTENAVTQGINTARTSYEHRRERRTFAPSSQGRWPANLIHDGSEGPTDLLGDAARFFYCAKASKRDRDEGLDEMEARLFGMSGAAAAAARGEHYDNGDGGVNRTTLRKNTHPTVKPTDLMAYLCRLVTPPSGVVLDPFMGSGSTGKAAMREGFRFIGCELSPEYMTIARARIEDACRQPRLIMDEQPIQEQGAMFEGTA
jgi:DNA modification methylase